MSLPRPFIVVLALSTGATVVAPAASLAAEPIGVLTLEAARTRALSGHPTLVRLRAQIRAAEARADQIGTALNPTVAGAVDATLGAQPPSEFGDPDVTVRAGLVGSWTITDFGRSSATEKVARGYIAADEASVLAAERDIARAVEEAFFVAKAQVELVEVARTTLAAETRHREEAERFVAAGTRAAIEVARAKTQEARAKTEVVRAETAARQALVALGLAMGLTTTPAGVEGAWSTAFGDESLGADALAERAMQGRPEVLAQRRRIEAAEAAILAADKGLLPFVSADAQVGVGSVGLEEWNPSWQIGVSFTWPFWDGGRTRLEVAAARADLEAMRVAMSELEVGIAAEIGGALEAVVSAKAEIDAAQAARDAAEVELRLAEERWREGLGSGIELADAQTRIAITAADRTRAELSLALARARLSRALGQ